MRFRDQSDRYLNVSTDHVARAKQLLANGASLQDAAIRLGVLSNDLDKALWRWCGERLTPRRPEPMW